MSKIKVKLKKLQDNSYDVIIGSGLDLVKLLPVANRYVIISDSNVAKLYGKKMLKELKRKYQTDLVFFPTGEKNKNREIKARLEDRLIKLGCGRDTRIIALGGGVVGDMAGFVAATYMRGISYVQIPTTLLAMVDSSVGGKTAIDTPQGKNLIGAFWQPKKVLVDVDYLNTLPREQLVNGLIETVKMFLTHDKKMFAYVENNLAKILDKDKMVLQKIITEAIEIKADVVGRDEREDNERMVLNFGHTIGHAIESLSGYKLSHGYAVALGILVEAKIVEMMKILPVESYNKIERMFANLGINKKGIKKFIAGDIIEATRSDKKNRAGRSRFILLKNIGEAYVKSGQYAREVNSDQIKKALKFFNHL